MARDLPPKFLVAFSFAGEQRELVCAVATAVEAMLGEGLIFYDDWFEAYIAGLDADTKLQEIYTKRSALVVVCVSQNYGEKPWTQMEHEAIRGLVMTTRGSRDKTEKLRILPLRVGDGEVEGIPFNAILPDIRQKTPQQAAELIVDRLKLAQRRIYLAKSTPDLKDDRDRMRACLEDLGWAVLPPVDESDTELKGRLRDHLRNSLAFVQLLGPKAWPTEALDRLQNEAAVDLKLPRFRYRSSGVDLASVEPSHRDVLADKEIIAGGFEDFKTYLEKELTVLQHRLEKPAAERSPAAGEPPLVRVVIRSPNPDPLWEKAFQWIYDQEQMRPAQLGEGESLEETHLADPCQGFLVVCDASALDEGPHSPRKDMEQCRQIQLREKNPARRPPVGLVYWPPPDAPWARLLRSMPHKLHRVVGDTPDGLREFFADVRKAGIS